jgi:hypothetical protein
LFKEVAAKVGDRPGGYTRILKTGHRLGDNAATCLIELVDYNENMLKEKAEKKTARTRRSKKSATAETPATETPAADVHVHHERVQIPAEEAVSIFVSIGKNRRVFPRDLVGLLIAVGGLERDRIGDIKVLANYSFVQLYANDAQTAIDKLNGYDYRGRKLAVSFSRQREEGESADVEDLNESAEDQYMEEDAEMAAEDAAAYAAAEKAASDKEPFGLN